MNQQDSLMYRRDGRGVATLTLNRPQCHNAFDDALIERLNQRLAVIAEDPAVRALVLQASGDNFSAGADLNWMRAMAGNSQEANLDDARALATLMDRLNRLPQPTLALTQGAVYGGAVGLAACCDLVIARRDCRFCLSEVRIGLIPAVISPYVIDAIGPRQARRYTLSAEPFDAETARSLGLVHLLAEDAEAQQQLAEQQLQRLLDNGPQAMAAAKALLLDVGHRPRGAELQEETARRIAAIRVSPEGQEGLGAFLEKRSPDWVAPSAATKRSS